MIDGLCRRYSCLPSALYAEDASILAMLSLVAYGAPPDDGVG